MLVQSRFFSELYIPFNLENNWPFSKSKMNEQESHHSSSDVSPHMAFLEDDFEIHNLDALEITTPSSYSEPSPTTSATVGEAELQPWLYQLFPEAENYSPELYQAPLENYYIPGEENDLIFPSPATTSRPITLQEAHGQVFYNSGEMTSSAMQIPEQPYEDLSLQSSKRVRLSPFSDCDSSSSEYDPTERIATTMTFSDYSRSPQLHTRSRANSRASTTRSSPALSSLSPDLSSAPTSSHLGASFAGVPKRRKSRRKLGPQERKEVHQLRKMGACTRCWGLKMKCGEGSPCPRCERLGTGHHCVRVHFVDLDVFSKWLVDSYSRTMMHHVLRWSNTAPRTITISHEKKLEVTMTLSAHEFIPEYPGQLVYWYKDVSGWRSMHTTPYALKRGINTDILEKYVDDHTAFYVENAFQGNSILSDIFTSALKHFKNKNDPLLKDVFQLWTATQLLIKGATLHPTSDNLEVPPILSPTSPLVGETPLPKALANQLDHLLERRIWQLEKQILSELQKRIFGRKREDWLTIFLTLVVFMNALERDTWRLYYWVFHMDDGYIWRHPSSPEKLIEKNNILAESLAAHFLAISKGLTPFSLDWAREQSIPLIGNCNDQETMLGALDRLGKSLRSPEHMHHVGNILSNYREADERSLDFLYTSKMTSQRRTVEQGRIQLQA